ncbi:MAG TPA: hypothetical protein DIT21_06715, partial [Oscillibacter sp.]|nr:hypothetical protein [Oscillibacter sp.]
MREQWICAGRDALHKCRPPFGHTQGVIYLYNKAVFFCDVKKIFCRRHNVCGKKTILYTFLAGLHHIDRLLVFVSNPLILHSQFKKTSCSFNVLSPSNQKPCFRYTAVALSVLYLIISHIRYISQLVYHSGNAA